MGSAGPRPRARPSCGRSSPSPLAGTRRRRHPATCSSTSAPTGPTSASSSSDCCSSSSATPSRWSTRCRDSATSTRATCSASSTAPRTRAARAWPRRTLIGDEDADVRRRQLRGRAEVPARPRRVERDDHRGAGGRHRPPQGRQRRARRHRAAAGAQDAHDDHRRATASELEILRDNMPFGSPAAGEFGTYFIGYSRRLWVIERMLKRMFIGDPPGPVRPHPRRLHRRHRRHVLRAAAAPARGARRRRVIGRPRRGARLSADSKGTAL